MQLDAVRVPLAVLSQCDYETDVGIKQDRNLQTMKHHFVLLSLSCIARSLFAADAAKTLTYDTDVKPILRARCFKCHGEDEKKDGLSLATYQDLMKGGSSGEIVKAGRPP